MGLPLSPEVPYQILVKFQFQGLLDQSNFLIKWIPEGWKKKTSVCSYREQWQEGNQPRVCVCRLPKGLRSPFRHHRQWKAAKLQQQRLLVESVSAYLEQCFHIQHLTERGKIIICLAGENAQWKPSMLQLSISQASSNWKEAITDNTSYNLDCHF